MTFQERLTQLIAASQVCRSGADPIDEWFDIGSEEACVLLDLSKGNRPISRPAVAKYGRLMADKWHKINDFYIDWEGVFRDGHHRAIAIKTFGRRVRIRITFGVSPDAIFEATDMGVVRTIPQQMFMRHGTKNAGRKSACVRSLMSIIQDGGGYSAYGMPEVREAIEACYDVMGECASAVKSTKKCPASVVGAALLVAFSEPELAKEFSEAIVEGTGLDRRDPFYVMREYLLNAGRAGGQNAAALSTRALYAMKAESDGSKLSKFPPLGKDETKLLVAYWLERGRYDKELSTVRSIASNVRRSADQGTS